MTSKICTKCNVEKTLDSFYKGIRHKFGVYSICKECCGIYYKNRYDKNTAHVKAINDKSLAKNPRSRRNTILKHLFGLSIDKFEEMLAKQNGLCAICGMSETNKDKNGKIR